MHFVLRLCYYFAERTSLLRKERHAMLSAIFHSRVRKTLSVDRAWNGHNCGSGNSLMKFKRFEVYDVTQKGLKVLI